MSVRRITTSLLAAAALPLALGAPAALADGPFDGGGGHGPAVYTSTNGAAGNAVLAFSRAPGGGLRPAGAFATGGTGTGAGLGNQGALALDHGRLYVVNAGSGDISVLDARHERPALRQRIGSGGATPISLTISGNVLYALNAGSGGIAGFRIVRDGLLRPIPGAARPLAGAGPAQIAFSPDGRTLVVTEKATNTIDTFAVGADGVAGPAVSRPSNGATPFGFDFDAAGHAIVSEAQGGAAGASTVSSYSVVGGTFTSISASVPDFQGAACWVAVTRSGRFAYVANTGSNDVSGYRIAPDGSISLLDPDGVTAVAGAAPADVAEGTAQRALYVRNGGDGTISSYRELPDGSLVPTGTVGGIPAGASGLAAE
ncbi:MAG TPA: beta-propeller fold lactonase family protein [Solirubrobacteraceae bacterium]|nr:beta-propeller fold lactonase family protein [Solirubrobacteraceae bacterium]